MFVLSKCVCKSFTLVAKGSELANGSVDLGLWHGFVELRLET